MNKKSRRKIVNIILLIIIMVAVIALVINIVKMNKTGENTNEQPGNELTQNAVEEKYVETLEDGTRLNTSTKLSEAIQELIQADKEERMAWENAKSSLGPKMALSLKETFEKTDNEYYNSLFLLNKYADSTS